eukprot:gb/GEZN01012879.1/.p1 GENE.gb/GEZN01012879.1/~~gb/GEZN01012879.1/.p1  ORF type:complete len:263 (-),score=26.77 gb/GEZN01012879.1/:200-988(-)
MTFLSSLALRCRQGRQGVATEALGACRLGLNESLCFNQRRNFATPTRRVSRERNPNTGNTAAYLVAAAVLMGGVSYASVPLYRMFCQATGYGGTVSRSSAEELRNATPGREVDVTFESQVSVDMQWKFTPCQRNITVRTGESVLTFFKAKNLTDKPMVGVATYNVLPFDVGKYFHKIQCFCFDEQRLRPQEELELPVFFYLDPAMDSDPRLKRINHVTLSYTFFPSKGWYEEEEEDENSDAEPVAESVVPSSVVTHMQQNAS